MRIRVRRNAPLRGTMGYPSAAYTEMESNATPRRTALRAMATCLQSVSYARHVSLFATCGCSWTKLQLCYIRMHRSCASLHPTSNIYVLCRAPWVEPTVLRVHSRLDAITTPRRPLNCQLPPNPRNLRYSTDCDCLKDCDAASTDLMRALSELRSTTDIRTFDCVFVHLQLRSATRELRILKPGPKNAETVAAAPALLAGSPAAPANRACDFRNVVLHAGPAFVSRPPQDVHLISRSLDRSSLSSVRTRHLILPWTRILLKNTRRPPEIPNQAPLKTHGDT